MASKIFEKKLIEAEQLLKEGDKLSSKGFFKKPDYEGAALSYEQAATNFKNAKSYQKAKEAFQKASNMQYTSNLTFSAAKNLESAATMAKELEEDSEAAELFQQSSAYYREQSGSEKSAECLLRAASCLEKSDPDKAVQLCMDACQLYEIDEKEQFAGQAFRTAISLLLRNKKFDETLELMKTQCKIFEKLNHLNDLFKTYLSILVLHLIRDDFVAAEKAYQEFLIFPGYLHSPESVVAGELLDAFEKRNGEALKTCLSKQVFTFLDNQVVKLAKTLKITGEAEGKEESLA